MCAKCHHGLIDIGAYSFVPLCTSWQELATIANRDSIFSIETVVTQKIFVILSPHSRCKPWWLKHCEVCNILYDWFHISFYQSMNWRFVKVR